MRFVVLVILLVGAWSSYAEKTNKIVVKIKPGVSIEELCSSHPLVKLERASTLPRVFLFSVENINDVDKETNKFAFDTRVVWAHVDEILNEEPDVMPADPILASGEQWFHGHINTSYAWSKGLSGRGQIVQVIDTPVFPDEKDLQGQLDFERSFEGNIIAPPLAGTHGTICTNLIVAKMNDFCGVGVAFSAKATSFPFIVHPTRRFTAIQFAEAYGLGFSVSSNSYGIAQCRPIWGCNIDVVGFIPAVRDALELAQNRNNTVFVFTAGNEGMNEGSPNFRSSGSTPRVMIVGATRINGTRASYSNVGAANWIVAPAGDHNENVTWSSSVTAAGQQCGDVGVGTSWAAPMVSGAAAILRSAYPWLSWRDVKYILAYSADKTDVDHESWFQNAAGRLFSNHYGFGLLNVGKAVELGAKWKSLGPLQIRTFHSNLQTPPEFSLENNVTVVEGQLSVPHGLIGRVESVQLTLNMNLVRRGEFQVDLISPSGTECVIFPFRNDRNRNYVNYITSANCFLDEEPGGSWTLRAQMRDGVTRTGWGPAERLKNFAVTVWGETLPSQVKLLNSSAATRLSSFTITEGDTFQQLTLFHNFPATIGLFWKDTFGLYGELFTTEGEATTGTQRLNPANSDHPTVSVFYGGDHVLTYLTTINDSLVMKAEVRDTDFIPLTPLTVLPLTDINPEYINTAAIEGNLIFSYKSSSNSLAKLVLLDVDFGSRDTTPLCIPEGNVTSDESDDLFGEEGNCTEVIYRRDGQITLSKQIEIQTQSPVQLESIGMNLVLGTWIEGSTLHGALIRADLSLNLTILQAPYTSIIRSAATTVDVFIAFGHTDGVLVERYDMNMHLHESFDVATADPVVAIDLAYTHVEGLSLVIATTKNISITLFLRSYDKTFVQTNQVTVASMLATTVPVLYIDQSVMPNGDLAVTFSTFQEIHVQLFKSSIFGTAPLPPLSPVAPPVDENPPAPINDYTPSDSKTPQDDQVVEESENRFPSWAIALIVLGGTMALLFGVMVIYLERKKRKHQANVIAQDPDLIAYTKMSV